MNQLEFKHGRALDQIEYSIKVFHPRKLHNDLILDVPASVYLNGWLGHPILVNTFLNGFLGIPNRSIRQCLSLSGTHRHRHVDFTLSVARSKSPGGSILVQVNLQLVLLIPKRSNDIDPEVLRHLGASEDNLLRFEIRLDHLPSLARLRFDSILGFDLQDQMNSPLEVQSEIDLFGGWIGQNNTDNKHQHNENEPVVQIPLHVGCLGIAFLRRDLE